MASADDRRSGGLTLRRLLRDGMILRSEALAFLCVSLLDFLATYLLLRHPEIRFVESNPIAEYWFLQHNVAGLIVFKCLLVAVVVAVCEIIAHRHLWIGRAILIVGTIVTAVVAVYGFSLLLGVR